MITGFPWYEPKFEFDEKDLIHVMKGPSQQTVMQDMILAFHRDVEGKLRQALIDMGWTPPAIDKAPDQP